VRQFVHPASTILFAEWYPTLCDAKNPVQALASLSTSSPYSPNPETTTYAEMLHHSRMTVSMADGHAESVTPLMVSHSSSVNFGAAFWRPTTQPQ
jgi:prepilin-type processing-associated H-X9-DG protein